MTLNNDLIVLVARELAAGEERRMADAGNPRNGGAFLVHTLPDSRYVPLGDGGCLARQADLPAVRRADGSGRPFLPQEEWSQALSSLELSYKMAELASAVNSCGGRITLSWRM